MNRIFLVVFFIICIGAKAITNTASAGATWAAATWSQGHVPLSSEDVVINSGVNLTIGSAAVCGSLTIGNATNSVTTLTIGAGGSLVVSGTSGNIVMNPNGVNRAFTIAVGAQTLSVSGSVTFPTVNTGSFTVSSGTLTFSSLINLSTRDNFTISGNATVNFNGGLTDGAGVFTAFSGCNINMNGPYTATGSAVVLAAGSNFVYAGNGTITPTAAITFSHFQINSGVAVTLAGAIRVAGNWTNNGGTVSGAFDVTFSGTSNSIGGTSGTAFSKGIIFANAAVYSLTTILTYSATSLTINAGSTATSLTHNGTAVLNISGNVTINQSTATVIRAWNINGGSSTVSGTLTYVGVATNAGRISQVNVTSGYLSVNALSFAANNTNANQVLSLTTGSITITNAYTLANGTITLTNTGTVNFNGLITHTGGIIQNTTTAGTINFAAGYNLSTGTFTTMAAETIKFGGNFTNSFAGGTILNATSTAVFTGTSTITPTRLITFGNLQVNTGVTATFVANISVAGNWTINGTGVVDATTNTTTITFNGASPQTISGNSTDFYNINIATGASVSLSSAQRLIQTITLNGTGQFNTNNQLTLVSTASATGNIAALATPANFTGNITMQRYISGTMGYRYIGSPISGATLSGLTPEIQLDGMTGGSNPTYWCNVYTYNEAATGVFANGWTAATNVTNPMSAGKGFAVYYYSINIPVTTDLSGPPNKGNQTLPVTYTSTPHADDGWNLVSNPYPSTIDWDAAVGWTRTNIQGNTVYCWNNASQNYASYPAGGPGVNGGTRYIASSQGFLVRANAAGPVLNMTESVKTSSNPSPQFWKVSGTPDPYAIKLKLSGNANSYRDESVIRFMSGALDKKDMGFDADKLTSTNAAAPYLATLSADSIALCVNSQPDFSVSNEIKIPVMVRAGVSGTYTITAELLNQFPLSACLILEDLSNGIKTTIKTDSSYSFTLATTSTPVKRFMLHISPPLINIKTEDITCNGLNNGSIIINGGSGAAGSWNYMLLDSTGKVIASKNNTTYVDTIRNLAAGKYKVTSYDSTAYCSNRSETIIISQPTPIFISTLSSAVNCSGMNDGSLSASASGGSGTYSYLWSNGALTEQITGLLAGTYTLTVKDGNNCYVSKTSSVLDGTLVKADFTMSNDTIYLLGTDSVHFTNKSIGATSFIWDFGDSTFSTDNDPTHSYSKVGTYTVKLYTFSTGCKDSIEYNITVLLSIPLLVLENTSDQVNAYCTDGFLLINWSVPLDDKILIQVLNGLGQEIHISEHPKTTGVSTYKIDMSAYSPGIYFINFISPKNHLTKKINYFK